MNINFELYRIFYAVAKNENITKAANELYISQPAVSKAIKKLEDNLGGKLFNRTKKGAFLTDEGKTFYNYIKVAMECFNNAENKFNDLINLKTGTIKIGASTTLTKFFLSSYIKEFNSKYPDIDILIETGMTKNLFSKLKDGLIDVLILNLPIDTKDKEITIKELKEIQDAFFANNKFNELKNKKISIKELNKYKIIMQAKGSVTRSFIDKELEKLNISLTPSMELTGYGLTQELTKIGLGIGYLTSEYEKDNSLFKIDTKEKIPKRKIGMAYSNKNLPSFATKEFIKLISKDVKF